MLDQEREPQEISLPFGSLMDRIMYTLVTSKEEAKQLRELLGVKVPKLDGAEAFCAPTTIDTPEGKRLLCVVRLGKNAQKSERDAFLTIVHEAVHVAQYLFETMGEDKPGVEVEAYTVASVVQGLLEQFDEKKKGVSDGR
jgi:hypothetical protein